MDNYNNNIINLLEIKQKLKHIYQIQIQIHIIIIIIITLIKV